MAELKPLLHLSARVDGNLKRWINGEPMLKK
jgi:hypothetical protein